MSYDGHCVKGKCKIKFMGKLHDAGCPEDDQVSVSEVDDVAGESAE